MSTKLEQALAALPTGDRLLLLWVRDKCRSYGSETPLSAAFIDNVRLLYSVWFDFARRCKQSKDIINISETVEALKNSCTNIKTLRDKQAARLDLLDRRYASRVEKQRRIDGERIDNGAPILLPLHFPFYMAPLSPVSKKKIKKATLPPSKQRSEPFCVDGTWYRYVDRREFVIHYGAIYRTSYRDGDVRSNQLLIDMNRISNGLPILLPYGFRFWAEGFGWDGLQSCPGGKAPVDTPSPDGEIADCPGWHQIDDNLDHWDPGEVHGVHLSDSYLLFDVEGFPRGRHSKSQEFEHEGKSCQYVDVLDYIDAYHMPGRVNMTDPWSRACIPFLDAVRCVSKFIAVENPAHVKLIELLSHCQWDDNAVASLSKSRIPGVLQDVLDYLGECKIGDGALKERLERWAGQKMPEWVERPVEGGFDWSASLFAGVYEILLTSTPELVSKSEQEMALTSEGTRMEFSEQGTVDKARDGGEGKFYIKVIFPDNTQIPISVRPVIYFTLKVLSDAGVPITLSKLRERIESLRAGTSGLKNAGRKSADNESVSSFRKLQLGELRKAVKNIGLRLSFAEALYLEGDERIGFDAAKINRPERSKG